MKALRRELEEKIEEQFPAEDGGTSLRVDIQQIDESAPLDPEVARRIIEALLFASSKPLNAADIKKVMKSLTPGQIAKYIEELSEIYQRDGRSFEILEIANGYEITTKKEYAPWIMKLELQKKIKQVTQSALETLAILAYKQPSTRMEIEELRGVDVSGVITTLMERGFIKIVGKKEVPGRPFLYGTTEKFLDHFGLKSLDHLPSIDEIKTLVENSVRKEDLMDQENTGANVSAPAAGDKPETAGETQPDAENSGAENPKI